MAIFFQIEDLSSQAQIQAAEKFKAPEATSVAGKEAEQEAVVADGDEEEVRRNRGPMDSQCNLY